MLKRHRGGHRYARAALVYLVAAAVTACGATAALAMGTHNSKASIGSTMPAPMPIRVLSRTTWQGMKIEARAMAPATFEIFTGTKARLVRPTKKDSLHLMVMLTDAKTNMAIPYASVWATIKRKGKIVYDERQWPMISRYMGPHYGNNVALPGKGTYSLTLLITPPQAARHMEYSKVWLKPHRVTMTFKWTGMEM
jgi:Fe2+ transport protein